MHANLVRPYVKRGLLAQKNAGIIEEVPDFKVSKMRSSGSFGGSEIFRVEILGFLETKNAYDVDSSELQDRLSDKLNANFVIVKPF